MNKTHETVSRSLAKTISWRIIVLVLDFLIAYAFTKNADISSKIAIAKLIVSSVFYFTHERFWNKVNWGKS